MRLLKFEYRHFFIIILLFLSAIAHAQDDYPEDPALFLSKLIQIRSVTGHEGAAGRYLLDYCTKKNLNTRIFSDSDSAFNFCASLYSLDEKKPNIIFLSHLDVIPAGDSEAWTVPPFSGVIKDGFVWGRGAIDCKGLLVMQLFSVLHYMQQAATYDLPCNVSLLFVSGEEGWHNNGSEYISENFLDELNPAVIYGEGGSGLKDFLPSKPETAVFGISTAEKRALWIRLAVNVKSSGHSAAPPELYANKRLLRALIRLLDERKMIRFDKESRQMFTELGKLEGGIRGFVIRHANWDIMRPFVKPYFKEGGVLHPFVYNTFVITNMSGLSGNTNQISDKAIAILDCRLLPEAQTDRFIKRIENIAGPKVTVNILLETPGAKPSDADSPYYKAMAASLQQSYPGDKAVPILFPATTDNNYYRKKGIAAYGIIPCIFTEELLATVHSIDERIPVSGLISGIQAFERCIAILEGEGE